MKRATLRELHLNTSALIREVAGGQTYVIERRGIAVAEIRPFEGAQAMRGLPNREKFLRGLPRVRTDSGRILEEDRS